LKRTLQFSSFTIRCKRDILSYIVHGLKADSHRGLKGKVLEAGGAILGTADLLGQMSDRAYLEKLLFLYMNSARRR
jgi:hypothetical protein